LDHSQDEQQDNGTDEGVDDRSNNVDADYDADLRQQPASDQTADNPDDDVTDQSVATALDHQPRKPTSYGTDDQPNDKLLLRPSVPPISPALSRAEAHSFFINRFLD
jgi:hypothetical protein